ncbi:glycosyltransferase family 22 protein [Cryomyces antarcticus]
MWRRTYLLLVLVRLYFALSPSYLHPDENFQGPEVIAGRVFSYPVHHTWEFTSEHPIRSVFPLWLVYGWPMFVLQWIWEGIGTDEVPPAVVYWTLRVLMFTLSFVLEDWAIHELVQPSRQRRVAVLLVASSYVTWTLQTHTFSNSIETLVVLWSLVLVERIREDKKHSGVFSSSVLASLSVLGTFNRITFPAFLLIPGLQLLPHFWRKPLSLLSVLISASFTALIAIYLDTAFYTTGPIHLSTLTSTSVVTPLNNFLYNYDPTNLAKHGLHPYHQHLLLNLPQLLGPAFPLLLLTSRKTIRFFSALTGMLLLSLFAHQEPRFLLPAVPLLLSSLRLPKRFQRSWIAAWALFNAAMGLLMGVYHQGGVVPTQMWLAKQDNVAQAVWWKTYPPPIWLLDGNGEGLRTTDLMGAPAEELLRELRHVAQCEGADADANATLLIAPRSAAFLDRYVVVGDEPAAAAEGGVALREIWTHRNHLSLDDLAVAEEGVWGSLKRVVGRRGLVVWNVRRRC